MRRAIKILNNDQIKALPTTAIEIVAAPTSSHYIFVFGAIFEARCPVTGYTNIDATAYFALGNNNDAIDQALALNEAANNAVSSLLTTVVDPQVVLMPHAFNAFAGPLVVPQRCGLSDLTGKKLELFLFNGSAGNLTAGAAGNTLRVIVFYDLVPI